MGTIAPSTGISGRRLPRPGVWSWFGKWRSNTVIGRGATPVNPDFKDLFAALNDAGVRFLLVGGYALAHHGHPRFTRDLGVWVEAEPENAARVFAALGAFGAPLEDLGREDLEREGLIFQIGVAPNRIDIVTSIDGVTFGEVWGARKGPPTGVNPSQ